MASIIYDLSLTNKTVVNNYTYKDVTTDLSKTYNNRDISVSIDYQAIQNGINNMFLFIQGERILLPEFGNTIYKYLYEPINDSTAASIVNEIKDMFDKWEPRVEIKSVNVVPKPDQNTYLIQIIYSVPSLNNEQILQFNTALNIRR